MMKKLKAVIVEDEANVREGFRKMINTFCEGVEVIGMAGSVEDGLVLIEKHEFDILFQDINLPDGSGFDLLHRAKNKDYDIIFVTAYDQYAVDAFKLSATDYLLKPVSPEALTKAIVRVQKKTGNEIDNDQKLALLNQQVALPNDQSNKIVLKDQESIHLVAIKDILYCTAEGSYTVFTLNNSQKIMTSHNLKEYEILLKPYKFLRPHHSYIANLTHVQEVKKLEGGALIMSDGTSIPLSTRKRSTVLDMIGSLYLS